MDALELLKMKWNMILAFPPCTHLAVSGARSVSYTHLSEGKDSRVLGHLMRRAGVKHFYMHNITGIDPPELVYFQRANFQTYRDLGYLTYDVLYEDVYKRQ